MIPQRGSRLVLPGQATPARQHQATAEETIAALRSERQILLKFLMALVQQAGGEVRIPAITLDPAGGDFAAVPDPMTGQTILRVAGVTLVDPPAAPAETEAPEAGDDPA